MTEFPQVTTEFNNRPHGFIIISARGDRSKRNSQSEVDALAEFYTRHRIEYAVYRLDHVISYG